jgi:beta-mannosidase
MIKLDLNGKWQFKRTDGQVWQDASVPGSVYNDLLNSGKMENPFYRENEYDALELSNYDYEYRRDFIIDETILNYDVVNLSCEGLDTLATVFVNDIKILNTDNMHRIYEINIKTYLRPGINNIHIVFKSPVEYVVRKQAELPLRN